MLLQQPQCVNVRLRISCRVDFFSKPCQDSFVMLQNVAVLRREVRFTLTNNLTA